MRDHLFDAQESALRPKGGRIEEPLEHHVGRAGVEGRTDVLGAGGLLGLQRSVGNAGVSALVEEDRSPVHDVIGSGGRPLEPDVRADMEGRLGADFGDVRIHDDGAAHDSATSVNAHAYTVGRDVVFQRDLYDPGSEHGRHMLAHELTHVMQQRSGPVDGTSAPGGIRVSDPGDAYERAAVANADRVMAAPATSAASVQRDVAVGEVLVQRDEELEDEEPVQGAYVQRDEELEDEEAAV